MEFTLQLLLGSLLKFLLLSNISINFSINFEDWHTLQSYGIYNNFYLFINCSYVVEKKGLVSHDKTMGYKLYNCN
jgi:hypothetical protein